MATGDGNIDEIEVVPAFNKAKLEGNYNEYKEDDSEREEAAGGGRVGKVDGTLSTSNGAGTSASGMAMAMAMARHKSEREKKLGHRRVGTGGEVTYKKIQTTQIMGSIQLGIQHAVGGLASKPERDLLMEDFMTVETTTFAADGSSHTPAHHYSEFIFKTYAPIAFRYFRDLFGIQPDDFLISFCSAPLRELSNPGASGSIFYLTDDDEFIIKTVQHKEGEFLQKLLPGYYMNLNQNPRTLLPKFFGLYCYQASKSERQKKSPTYKDLDFMDHHTEGLYLEADTYNALVKTIQRDCRVLESFKIMDYSLLVGIHNLDQAAREKAERRSALKHTAQHEDVKAVNLNRTRSINRQRLVAHSTAMESIQAESEPIDEEDDVPPGGIPARNAKGERLLLFIGIIDILQSYRLKKKLEHTWKSILHDGDTVSVHKPGFYAQRFQDFMAKTVFRKIPSLDLPEIKGNHRKFRTLVTSYIALKHSPSKRKSISRPLRQIDTDLDGTAQPSCSGTSKPGPPQIDVRFGPGTNDGPNADPGSPTSPSLPSSPPYTVPARGSASSPPPPLASHILPAASYPSVLKDRSVGGAAAGVAPRVPPPVPPRGGNRKGQGQGQGHETTGRASLDGVKPVASSDDWIYQRRDSPYDTLSREPSNLIYDYDSYSGRSGGYNSRFVPQSPRVARLRCENYCRKLCHNTNFEQKPSCSEEHTGSTADRLGGYVSGLPSCSTPPPAFEDAISGDYVSGSSGVSSGSNPTGGGTPLRHRIQSHHHSKSYKEETVSISEVRLESRTENKSSLSVESGSSTSGFGSVVTSTTGRHLTWTPPCSVEGSTPTWTEGTPSFTESSSSGDIGCPTTPVRGLNRDRAGAKSIVEDSTNNCTEIQ